jgi:hypothetical protein
MNCAGGAAQHDAAFGNPSVIFPLSLSSFSLRQTFWGERGKRKNKEERMKIPAVQSLYAARMENKRIAPVPAGRVACPSLSCRLQP